MTEDGVERDWSTINCRLPEIARRAFRKASQQAMKDVGHIVTTDGDWVVKKFADGHVERLHKFKNGEPNEPLYLD